MEGEEFGVTCTYAFGSRGPCSCFYKGSLQNGLLILPSQGGRTVWGWAGFRGTSLDTLTVTPNMPRTRGCASPQPDQVKRRRKCTCELVGPPLARSQLGEAAGAGPPEGGLWSL